MNQESTSFRPWPPLTPAAVAACATGRSGRLFWAQIATAAGSALVAAWLAAHCVAPVVNQAIPALPDQAAVRWGRLQWPDENPSLLAGNPFVSFGVNPSGTDSPVGTSDLDVLLGPAHFRIRSLLGHWEFPYPQGWTLSLSRADATAWWSAWRGPSIVMLLVGGTAGFLVLWWMLGGILLVPVGALSRCMGRGLSLGQSWRLACASLLPPAILVSLGLLLYGLQRFHLVALLAIWVAHLPLTLLYLFAALFWIPQRKSLRSVNPFSRESPAKSKGKPKNPFAS